MTPTVVSYPNEHGVYTDGLETIECYDKSVRVKIFVVHCEDDLWRWKTDLCLLGRPWGFMGGGGLPHSDSPGYASRSDALREAADFLRERMFRYEQSYRVANTSAGRQLRQWLEDIGLGVVEQLALF